MKRRVRRLLCLLMVLVMVVTTIDIPGVSDKALVESAVWQTGYGGDSYIYEQENNGNLYSTNSYYADTANPVDLTAFITGIAPDENVDASDVFSLRIIIENIPKGAITYGSPFGWVTTNYVRSTWTFDLSLLHMTALTNKGIICDKTNKKIGEFIVDDNNKLVINWAGSYADTVWEFIKNGFEYGYILVSGTYRSAESELPISDPIYLDGKLMTTLYPGGDSGNGENSGNWGENASYVYNQKTGELTVSGTKIEGTISQDLVKSAKSIVIKEGIEEIGEGAFAGFEEVTFIDIPSSVTSIGASAFADCKKIDTVYYSNIEGADGWEKIKIADGNSVISNCQKRRFPFFYSQVEASTKYDYCGNAWNNVETPRYKADNNEIISNAEWFADGIIIDTVPDSRECLFVQWKEGNEDRAFSCRGLMGTLSATTIGGEGFVLNSDCKIWIEKTVDSMKYNNDNHVIAKMVEKRAEPAEVTLNVENVLKGNTMEDDETFTYELKSSEGATIDTKEITGSDDVNFNTMVFEQAGTYTYTIAEKKPDTETTGMSYDDTVYTVTLTVEKKNGDYEANKTITYVENGENVIADGIKFTNTYTKVTYQMPVQNEVEGNPPSDDDFEFVLSAVNDAPAPDYPSVGITGSFSGTFGEITYYEAGTYTYTVTETAGSDDHYTYDDTKYTVAVSVVADETTGALSIGTVTVTDDEDNKVSKPVFTNKYKPNPVDVTIQLENVLQGNQMSYDETFAFELKDSEGTVIETVENKGSGFKNFSAMTFEKAGTYTYTVAVKKPNTETTGMAYDGTVYKVNVAVTQNEANLQATKTITRTVNGEDITVDSIKFTNTYTKVTYQIPVENKVEGNPPSDDDFTFVLSAVNGAPAPDYPSVGITGSFSGIFGEITYHEAGTYTYTVTETAGSDDHYTYDDTKYTVAVSVVADETTGALSIGTVTVTDDEDNKVSKPVFTNKYKPNQDECTHKCEDGTSAWSNGVCTVCDKVCNHDCWTDWDYSGDNSHRACTTCGKVDECSNHDWSGGVCTICGKVCTPEMDESGNCKHCGESLFTVTVSSESGAQLNGGGLYHANVYATITAEAKPGYNFNGWYDGSEQKSNYLAYSFEVTNDVQYTAKYTENVKYDVTITGTDGVSFYVGDDTTTKESVNESYLAGTVLTITAAEPDKVSAWYNGNGKVLGSGASITITVTSATTINLSYKNETPNSAVVRYYSLFDQLIAMGTYTEKDTITEPIGPSRTGYSFVGWSLTPEDIRAKIISGETEIIVKPEYEATNESYHIIIDCMANGTTDVISVPVGTVKQITANEIDGMTFSYWSDGNDNILSYSPTINVFVDDNQNLRAHYDENVQAEPVITISSPNAFWDAAANKISFTTSYDVPEGYEVVSAGILRSTTASGDTLVIGGSGVRQYTSMSVQNQGSYTYTVNVGTNTTTTVYARGYLIYKDTKTGNNSTLYSSEVSGSHDSLTGN